jgi:hypothetical protein
MEGDRLSIAAAPPRAPSGDRRFGAVAIALLASLAIHAAILALAARRPVATVSPLAERPVAVEILTPEEFETLTAPPPPAAPPPVAARAPAEEAGGGMVRPTTMLSAATLADPRSAQARAMLATVDDTEKMIQLCGLEAMEQVHAWRQALHPTAVVAYATAEVGISGDRVDADGAAFRSGASWYRLRFRCHLRPDHAAVAAFEFKVGALVPEERWEAFNLPADPGPGSD